MIVKNEEQVLPACLESVRDLAGEIVVVDTGSTDATSISALSILPPLAITRSPARGAGGF